ncbi:GNAT family N-acetyltransferase [Actibacterium sp.]|uniref:GNAT family N-acetyltransferase n=1 Tax=Actibacterium sp. TaxID=1872125 RepID=UPI003562A8FB
MSVSVALTDVLASCHAIRRAVFIDEQRVPEAIELDEQDTAALHLLAVQDGVPVGTARLLLKAPVGKIGRVVVLASHRGTGLGQALMRVALEVLAQQPGITTARLGAQTHAIGFYQRLGFHAVGDEYSEAGIPHRDMECPIFSE